MAKPASGTSLDTGHALYSVMRHIWALLEGSGTTSVDSKGSNNLTLSGSGLWATNGGGENIIRIATAENAPLTIGTPFTLGVGNDWSLFFIAKEAADDNAGMVIGDRTTTLDALWLNAANGFTFRYGSLNNNIALSGANRTTVATYAVTYAFIGAGVTTVRIYRNGSLLGNFDNSGFQPTFNTLGNGYTSTTFALQGDIECCYVFDAALSSTDVSNLHAAPYGIFSGGGGGGATAYTFTGPSSGLVNVASTNFTITLNGTPTGTIVVTPASDGSGSFTPSSLSFNGATTTGTFTYTPTSTSGSPHTLSVTDDGGLTDPASIDYTVNAGAIAITAPVAKQWKRGGGSSITMSANGTYTGSPGGSIKYRLDNGGGYGSYATVDAAPSGGNWAGTITLPTSTPDYTVEFSFGGNSSVTATATGLANLPKALAKGGQSNEDGRISTGQTGRSTFGLDTHRMQLATGPADLTDPTSYNGSGSGSYAVHEISILGTALGCRIGLVNLAVGGTTILQWQKGGTGAGYYELLAAAITAVGGCDLLTMGPCESDAINGTSQANYHTRMAAFVADWLADFPTCKIIWRTLQHIDLGQATQPQQDAINAAILAGAGSVHGVAGGDITGVYLAEVRSVPAYPGDLYHWLTDQQAGVVGGIMATADLMAMNLRKPHSSSLIGI